jgi:hypothetical protein
MAWPQSERKENNESINIGENNEMAASRRQIISKQRRKKLAKMKMAIMKSVMAAWRRRQPSGVNNGIRNE